MKGEHLHNKIGHEIFDILSKYTEETDSDDIMFILIRVLYSQICVRKEIAGTDEDFMIKTIYDTLHVMHGENTRR